MATTIYRLTNVDTGDSRYFNSLEAAIKVGDGMLEYAASWQGVKWWKESTRNFSVESNRGWQRNNGQTFLEIIPITTED